MFLCNSKEFTRADSDEMNAVHRLENQQARETCFSWCKNSCVCAHGFVHSYACACVYLSFVPWKKLKCPTGGNDAALSTSRPTDAQQKAAGRQLRQHFHSV